MAGAPPSDSVRQTLRFETLEGMLLLKNGNYLYRIPYRGGEAVLKVYYGSRPLWRYMTGTFGNLVFSGQTSFMPKARLRTELECIALWRRHGFRVFDVYDVTVIAPGVPPDGYAVYEYVPGRRFVDLLPDPAVPEEEKLALYRRFLEEWHRRHELAIRTRDPRLIHENGDMKHVMLWKDELVWFDFEMCFRSRRRVREFVAREILAYLKSLGKVLGAERFDHYLEETVRHYPGREHLEYAHTYIFRNPNPLRRIGRWLDYRLKARPRKPFSKHNVARRLREMLAR
jgi:hypothetical protein